MRFWFNGWKNIFFFLLFFTFYRVSPKPGSGRFMNCLERVMAAPGTVNCPEHLRQLGCRWRALRPLQESLSSQRAGFHSISGTFDLAPLLSLSGTFILVSCTILAPFPFIPLPSYQESSLGWVKRFAQGSVSVLYISGALHELALCQMISIPIRNNHWPYLINDLWYVSEEKRIELGVSGTS